MEIPFKYIILLLFRFLDDRDMALVLKRSTLTKYMASLIRILSTSADDFEEIISTFNFEEELDLFISEYSYYLLDNNENSIIFDYEDIEELDCLIESAEAEYDENLIDVIADIMYNEVSLIETLGVKIEKELYHVLLNNEEQTKRLYSALGKVTNSKEKEEIIKKINSHRKISRKLFDNMDKHLDYSKCYDLLIYADDYTDKRDKGFFKPVKIHEENPFVTNGAILRSIFGDDDGSLYMFTLRDKMDKFMINKDTPLTERNMSELNFYLLYLSLLDREINASFDYELREELIAAKYRLMYVLDTIYDVRTFLSYNDPVVSFQENNYNFIREIVYKLIEDILDTTDTEYFMNTQSGKPVKDIISYYYTVIEKLFVEAYFSITKDKNIIEAIKGNEYFGINKISSSFLSEILSKPKKRIKEN